MLRSKPQKICAKHPERNGLDAGWKVADDLAVQSKERAMKS